MNKAYPEVGDLVHFWRADPPPLSQDYVAPACLPALLVSAPTEPDEKYRQYATVAVVTDAGLLVVTGLLRVESHASTGLRDGSQSDRNYGVPASWHSWDHTTKES